MIVYKYMSLEGLEACLRNRTIRFSKPVNFNDPFDCAASTGDTRQGSNIRACGSTNTDRLLTIRNAIGVLSLTRNPLNPLMWAHYGSNHTGGVVAIDAEDAGLECAETNIITASTGNIIYTTVRPTIDGDLLPYHDKISAMDDRLMLERLFLYKSLRWAYEEEIRIARRVDYKPQIRFEDFEIPRSAIKAVYLGARYFSALNNDYDGKLPKVHLNRGAFEFHLCYEDSRSWDLRSRPYSPTT